MTSSAVSCWRSLGLELAFDPDAPPPDLAAAGRDQLAAEIAHLDPERLMRFFPREPSGKLPLETVVLLTTLDRSEPHRPPKAHWLVARSPDKRSSPQVVTLAIQPEIARNASHRWDQARWLWDTREVGSSPPPLDEVAVRAIELVRQGRWRDALDTCGVSHALDDLPYATCNAGKGIEPALWDAGLAAGMRMIAPWRLVAALADLRPRSTTGLRLFLLPNQYVTKKWSVVLRREAGRPHLAVELSGTNERLPLVAWQWPPDLALVILGDAAASPTADAGPIAHDDDRVRELLVQIAAHPADDDLRRVYADLLGDSRSELLALQLAPPTSTSQSRILSLIRKHARTWLGPLGVLVDLSTIRFERGFLDRVVLGAATTPFDAWAGALTDRARLELAHVTRLGLAAGFPPGIAAQLLADPPPGLQRLVLGATTLVAAVSRAVPELEVFVPTPEALTEEWPLLRRAPGTIVRVATERRHLRTIMSILEQSLGDVIAPIVHLVAVAETDEVYIGARVPA